METFPTRAFLHAEEKKKTKKAPDFVMDYCPVPFKIKSIWTYTRRDQIMRDLIRDQKRIQCRMAKYEEILREVIELTYARFESPCKSKKVFVENRL